MSQRLLGYGDKFIVDHVSNLTSEDLKNYTLENIRNNKIILTFLDHYEALFIQTNI